MLPFITTNLGRLRLVSLLEGLSLLALLGIAMPAKYIYQDPTLVKAIGPVHGILFLLFVLNTFSVAIMYRWKFTQTTWKVLLACIIPFGTFYVDRTILSPLQEAQSR